MLRFLTMRVLGAIPLLFLLSIVTFAIIQAPPGDYGDTIRSMLMNQGGVPAEQAEAQAEIYRQAHGLNDPMIVQYFRWITGIVTRFDFGHSFFYNKPVGTVVAERLPATIALALVCHLLASGLGIGLGILAATRQYSWVDTGLGIAYNMRVMRGNLLDVLNSQYVETARAKGLPEGAVIMKHAVPNALHPLVAYQGVALPYMLTGEIEVAIVFGLATVGPAIVGSMGAGDVYVTATFMLVLAATLIVGNIISDVLLVALDPRVRLGGGSQ
jgi:ABC-type dipeptide/oligopeptide/nickel transport system permease component